MRDDILNALGLIVLGLVILLGLLASVQMLSVSPLWSEAGAAWVGAIGTVGTLIGTVWLATTETRRRHKQDVTRGIIVAAALAPRIKLLADEVGAFYARLTFRDPAAGGYKTPGEETADFMAINFIDASTEELMALQSMPNNCATKLAYAQAQFASMRMQIGIYLRNARYPNVPLAPSVALRWRDWTYDLLQRLEVLGRQCSEAAQTHATPPTQVERFGE